MMSSITKSLIKVGCTHYDTSDEEKNLTAFAILRTSSIFKNTQKGL